MVFNSCTIPQTVGADPISARPMPSPSSVASVTASPPGEAIHAPTSLPAPTPPEFSLNLQKISVGSMAVMLRRAAQASAAAPCSQTAQMAASSGVQPCRSPAASSPAVSPARISPLPPRASPCIAGAVVPDRAARLGNQRAAALQNGDTAIVFRQLYRRTLAVGLHLGNGCAQQAGGLAGVGREDAARGQFTLCTSLPPAR